MRGANMLRRASFISGFLCFLAFCIIAVPSQSQTVFDATSPTLRFTIAFTYLPIVRFNGTSDTFNIGGWEAIGSFPRCLPFGAPIPPQLRLDPTTTAAPTTSIATTTTTPVTTANTTHTVVSTNSSNVTTGTSAGSATTTTPAAEGQARGASALEAAGNNNSTTQSTTLTTPAGGAGSTTAATTTTTVTRAPATTTTPAPLPLYTTTYVAYSLEPLRAAIAAATGIGASHIGLSPRDGYAGAFVAPADVAATGYGSDTLTTPLHVYSVTAYIVATPSATEGTAENAPLTGAAADFQRLLLQMALGGTAVTGIDAAFAVSADASWSAANGAALSLPRPDTSGLIIGVTPVDNVNTAVLPRTGSESATFAAVQQAARIEQAGTESRRFRAHFATGLFITLAVLIAAGVPLLYHWIHRSEETYHQKVVEFRSRAASRVW